jgi:microcystin degradation protein MlrC
MLSYLLEKEDEFTCDLLPCDVAVDEAIRLTEKVTGPIILADVQDNAGGGSPSDTVWLLDALVHKNVSGSVLGLLYDPQAAAAAHTAGMGNIIDLEVGGHSLPGHEPFLGSFYVESLHEGPFMGTGPMVKDRQIDLGKMACLVIGNVRLVVASIRMQALDQSQFRVVGIEPAHQRILALKSANHYRADFGPIAGGIINVEAPSAIIEDPSKIPYTRLRDGVRLKGLGPVFARPNP